MANKFQTGFDQPLLHTMYVDKKLGGVNAVQTLSRLNRIHPGKEETMVLDFANEAEEIQKAFQPYYDRTLLTEGTDPNLLYDLQTQLEGFHFYTPEDVDRFAAVYFDPQGHPGQASRGPGAGRGPLQGRAQRGAGASSAGPGDYVRLYAFLSQILTFADADLEKLYVFGRLLLRKLPVTRDTLPVEIQQNIDMDAYRVKQTGSGADQAQARPGGTGRRSRRRSRSRLRPTRSSCCPRSSQDLNEHFGTDFTRRRQGVHRAAGGQAGRRSRPGSQRPGQHAARTPA